MKKHIKQSVTIATVFCLVGIIVIGLCVNNNRFSPLNEEDIVYSLCNSDDVFSDYSLTIDSYNIIRRQTNEEMKTDYVWLSLDSSNDVFSYHSDYELTFVLYNDGWMLENFESDNETFTATHPEKLTQSEADLVVSGMGFDKYTFAERIDEENRISFVYFTEKSEFYLKTLYTVTLVYDFSPSLTNPWGKPKVSITKERRLADELLGEWLYEDENCRFYINIIDIDIENISITLEYELENVEVEGYLSTYSTTLKSDGIITKTSEKKNGQYELLNWGIDFIALKDAPIYIWFGNKGDMSTNPNSFSESEINCGVWAGYHWLEKQQ